ncbi:hypothetical protein L8V01_02790 [Corynebacterium sp. c8Ua_181]|uniref:Guanylate cyclase domain-containing protein n=1 Tax=Corynebacterium curieae TaxID=2913500 RepID=A0A9X3M9Y5_9CORY|nr:adenylate/guanylate cyclase domain-containing protein [Corynebacterium curieae]MCZ9306413.1 hypothetical protein [Corynebacterium curieae]MDV2424018.1 hypothetical protein [Corynebacterium curieae]
MELKNGLRGLLGEVKNNVAIELERTPEVEPAGDSLVYDDLKIEARRWKVIDDAVVVMADLKNSTKLGMNKWVQSTANIYEASTGSVAKIFDDFGADFISIQGDGAYAIFWGERRIERALCAGVTIKTFGEDLLEQLKTKWDSLPDTGLKVGIASGKLLAKKVGVRRKPGSQAPIWPGKPVNYAFKASASVDKNQMAVTKSVWNAIKANDFLTWSCTCNGEPSLLWQDLTIKKLPEGAPERQGMFLASAWCPNCGEEFCESILRGEKKRSEVDKPRLQVSLERKRANELKATRNLRGVK